jgi:acetylornithine deacetylase/succinyl-diaminopimelate desuccinylase-like protein
MDAERKELVKLFQDLLRFDTTNPPGNETAAAEYLKRIFDREGIPCEVVESQPGRGNFIATLDGDSSTKPRLLLLSHLDVVPATRVDAWKHPPFSGELDDGWVYGRGAIDTKYLTAAEAMAMILLKRSGARLKGGLRMAAVADEERGGNFGAGWLCSKHPEKMNADYVINEGGGLVFKTKTGPVYLVEAEEKGICWVKATTKGVAAHASIPELGDSAVARMSEALARIARYRTRPMPSPTLKKMLYTLLERQQGTRGKMLARALLNRTSSDSVLSRIRKRDSEMASTLSALLRMTISETMVKGGVKENVIPDQCEAVIDCRLPQGMTREDALRELKRAIGDLEGVEFETIQYSPASTSPVDNDFYTTIRKTLKETVGDNAEVAPFVVPGATDSRYIRPFGAIAYGFAPTSPDVEYRDLIRLVHGVNERINAETLYTCTDFLVKLCENLLA